MPATVRKSRSWRTNLGAGVDDDVEEDFSYPQLCIGNRVHNDRVRVDRGKLLSQRWRVVSKIRLSLRPVFRDTRDSSDVEERTATQPLRLS